MSLKFARLVLLSIAIASVPGVAHGLPDLIWPVCDISRLARLPEKGLSAPQPGEEPTAGIWWQDPATKIYLDYGTPVFAAGNGYVLNAERSGPFGLAVDVAHIDNIFTRYGNLQTVTVQAGTRVAQGQKIGTVGSTGRSWKPGLYLAVHNNDILLAPENLMRRAICRDGTIIAPPPLLRGSVQR